MNARIIKIWYDLQSSYYFIPAIMVFLSIILAVITSHIDNNWDPAIDDKLSWFYSNKASGARAVLSTIAGSMISVAAVTFSITMVAVTTASAQYGPRLIGNFMRDRANQFTLGTFTSTFVYALLILRSVRTGDAGTGDNLVQAFVPNLSLLTAITLTLVNVGVMIYFIHHIPETLNVGNILGRVGRQLRDDIDDEFPKNLGTDAKSPFDESKLKKLNAFDIKAHSEGFVQTLDESGLIKMTRGQDLIAKIHKRPGDFVTHDDILMTIWSKKSLSSEEKEKLEHHACTLYAMGLERTAHQNILFLADELVEILARALSPGVNDPFTAINALNWYHSALTKMMKADIPSPYRLDEDGEMRVIVQPIDFTRLLDNLLDQSRNYIAADNNVTKRLLEILIELHASAETKDQKSAIKRQAEKLVRAANTYLPVKDDQVELNTRLKAIS